MKQTLFLLALTVFVACRNGNDPSVATAPGNQTDSISASARVSEVLGIAIIEPSQRITNISSEQSGIVRDIKVSVGQKLAKGQTILVLDNAIENAQLRQASSKIGTQNEAVEAARENLQLLQVKLQKSRADLSRDESLFKGNALTQQDLDNSRYEVTDLEQQIKAQEATIRQQQTRIGELQADIAYYETVNNQKILKSPAAGTLLSLDARIGQFLDNKVSIGDFAPDGPVIALTEIDELFADRVQVGQKAIIRPQGRNGVLTTGTVVLTSPYLRKKSLFSDKPGDLEDRRVREVRVQLDDPSKVLLGARVECIIRVDDNK
ncbi:MAG TPA: efflux RND transporter periplasmic adaptor subunit [Saprospiraceae bacterium]|nr:efflux RND transporter periplasmic adaptor subunit [Saprospiraceae bacterium]